MHHNRNRHVLILSTISNSDSNDVQPSFRHVTSSVSAVKSGTDSALKNAKAIIDMLGLHLASFYGGGTNDNASDAQIEIRETHAHIASEVRDSGAQYTDESGTSRPISELMMENGVWRRAILFGDPFHIANLCVTWASVFAFGETEKVSVISCQT